MASKNDITGDSIQTKTSTKSYEDGWDRIFGKKEEEFDVDQAMKNHVDGWPNDKIFGVFCEKCGFKQQNPDPVLCESCGTYIPKTSTYK